MIKGCTNVLFSLLYFVPWFQLEAATRREVRCSGLQRSLTTNAAHSLVRALIHSRPDEITAMASLLAFQPDRWLHCSLSFALLPDSYFSCQPCSCVSLHARHASLVQLPTTNHLQVVSAHLQASPRSCTSIPVAVLSATVCPLRSVSTAFCRSSSAVCSANPHKRHGFSWIL